MGVEGGGEEREVEGSAGLEGKGRRGGVEGEEESMKLLGHKERETVSK